MKDGWYLAWVNDTGYVLDGMSQTYDPDMGVCGSCNRFGGVDADPTGILAAPQTYDTIDFAFNQPGSLGDTLFSDANSDGDQDPGEPGLAGVTVQLWKDANGDGVFNNTLDTLIGSKVTDGSGQYLFTGLSAGIYFASVDNTQAALSGYTATTSDQETGANAAGTQLERTLVAGASNLTADFGYNKAGLYSIGDLVYHDLNGDGSYDPAGSESGLAGVTLALFKDSNGNGILDPGEPQIASTTSSAGGAYSFNGLPSGDYLVVVDDANDILDGYQHTAGLHPWPVTLSGASRTDVDFGYVRKPANAAIGDTVWFDLNGDGIKAVTEDGLPNVLLNLYLDANGNRSFDAGVDTLVDSVTTDGRGEYIFTGLPAGVYFVQADSANFTAGQPLYGLASTTGGNVFGPVYLSAGEYYPDADLGYLASGYSIGDYVWSDADGDGYQDPGEPGLGGVLLELISGGVPTGQTVTTAPDGSYRFTGLAQGQYQVRVAVSNFASGGALQGFVATSGPQSVGSNLSGIVDIGPSSPNASDVDFGYDAPNTGSIGDHIWLDKDLDGAVDAGEPGLENITVDLILDSNGNGAWDSGEPTIATTLTNANGDYSFNGLDLDDGDGDADYLVFVHDNAGLLLGLGLTAGSPCTNPCAAAISTSTPNNEIDFAYDDPDLGDFIWHDANHDGIQDSGESGIEGVLVQLYHDADGDGVIDPGQDDLLKTTTTDASGNYWFAGLPFESFIIKVAGSNFNSGGPLQGFSPTVQDAFSNGQDAQDSDANPANNQIAITPLAAKDFTLDAGYYAPTGYSIGDRIWLESDKDGVRETGENGIPNLTVYLYRDLDADQVLDPGDVLIGQQLTDSNGQYLFTNLPNGRYIIQTRDQNGALVDFVWVDGPDPDGTNDHSQSPTYAVLVNNSNVLTADSAYLEPPLAPTAVSMGDFSATLTGSQVFLVWNTETEVNFIGFNVYRSTSPEGERLLLSSEMILAEGGLEGATYQFTDPTAQTGVTYYYWLEVIDSDGVFWHGPAVLTLAKLFYIPVIFR